MNGLGSLLLWSGVQVSLFALVSGIVYVLARRRGPAAGSLIALAAVLLVFGVSLLTFSPWPHWWSPGAELVQRAPVAPQPPEIRNLAGSDASAQPETHRPNLPPAPVAAPASTMDGKQLLHAAWSGMLEGLQAPRPVSTEPSWRWQALVACLLLTGMGVGLLRLIMGLIAVARYRRHSCPIDDSDMSDRLAIVCAELGCNCPVALHESPLLDSPAVVGWRRPLVLLPGTWRTWTAEERQAVLAHEMGHVAHNDYVSWVLAQVSLIINFYNPLVHWLVGRLRMEQELAADGSGARLAGGRAAYLRILAGMALCHDNRQASWAARPFLPARGTFLRRIEMLRDAKSVGQPQLALTSRVFLLGALTVAALFAAGLRAPLVGETANLAENSGLQGKGQAALTGEYLPAGAIAAVAVRVPELLRLSGSDELRAMADELPTLKHLGISIKDLDEIKVGVLDLNQGPAGPAVQLCVRTLKPFDWLKAMQTAEPTLHGAEFGGAKYLTSPQGPGLQLSFYMPDDRTMIGAPEARIRDLIQTGGKDARPAWADGWDKVSGGPLVGMINLDVVGKFLDAGVGRMPGAILATIAPLWQNTRVVVAGVSMDKTLSLHAIAETPSAEAGKKVSKNLQAVATLGENLLDGLAKSLDQAPETERAAAGQIIALGKELLGHLEIKDQGNLVDVQTHSEKISPKKIANLIVPAIFKMRQAASRNVSANNLKQIALAMHNYHSTFNHFPAAVIIGPDGKTPHSWRVEILPYIEQIELYKAYKMDEPWDSPNNKKVLAKMPRVFSATPNQPSTVSSYYVLSGKETAFPGEQAIRIADITDGTSNTILAVESKRDIPWTKPEDLEYDPKKPLPKFGGFYPEGFNAALCDGSVRFLSNAIAEQVMRALITRSGGEVIPAF
jgi:beta-lactamase regulating signal transducer with metallopeptidase domain